MIPATLASFSRAAGRSVCLAVSNKHVRHIDDQAARCIPSFENRVELQQQLGAKLRPFGLGLRLFFSGTLQVGLCGDSLSFVLLLQTIRFCCWPRRAGVVFLFQAIRFGLRSQSPSVVLPPQAICFGLSGGGLRVGIALHPLGALQLR